MTDTGGRGTKKVMEEREAFREFYLKYAKKLYRVVERLQEIQEGKVGDITEDVV